MPVPPSDLILLKNWPLAGHTLIFPFIFQLQFQKLLFCEALHVGRQCDTIIRQLADFWTYSVHFESSIVNFCNLLNECVQGGVYGGAEKKLTFVPSLHMQLHHLSKSVSSGLWLKRMTGNEPIYVTSCFYRKANICTRKGSARKPPVTIATAINWQWMVPEYMELALKR